MLKVLTAEKLISKALFSKGLCQKLERFGATLSWLAAAKTLIHVLVFSLPLFIFPATSNFVDFPKQLLLSAFLFATILCYLADKIYKEEAHFKLNWPLYLSVLFLLLMAGISTFLSYARYTSFWGWPLNVNQGFVTLALFAALFVLIGNVFKELKEIVLLLTTFLVSAALAAVFGLLQILGIFLLPFELFKFNSLTSVGSPSEMAVFSAALLPMAAVLFFSGRRALKTIAALCFLPSALILLITNSWIAWLVLLAGSVVLVAAALYLKKIFTSRALAIFMSMMLLAAVFAFARISMPGLPSSAPEVYPTYRAAFNINWQALQERPLFGTGPGTFLFNYSKFKNPLLNRTIFWNVRFRGGSSGLIDTLGNGGITGISAWLLLIIVSFYFALRAVRQDPTNNILIASFAGFAGAASAFIFSGGTINSVFLFWMFLGCLLALGKSSEKTIILKNSGRAAAASSFTMALLIIFGLGFSYFNLQRFLADINYASGVREFNRGNLLSSSEFMAKALSATPGNTLYYRDFAQIELALARQELTSVNAQQPEVAKNAFTAVQRSVNAANAASGLEPQNVSNWIVRGFIYQNIIGTVEGAENAALEFGYKKALELEPANPFILTSAGRVYLQKAVMAQSKGNTGEASDNLIKAEEHFKKAIALKPDFAPAHFNMALAAQMKGNAQDVINNLEQAKKYAESDTGLAFQLGVIYYRLQEYSKAKAEFLRAISYAPNYSNARYFLGLIYDMEGRQADAINEFVKIEELNPANQEVKKILANLRSGTPALSGLAETQPPKIPIEEGRPEEIKK